MLVLTWNLFHGRAVPPAGRPLLHEFAAALAGWEWDVALLQEVPPWWPPLLARACGAERRTALTSRNALLPLRRAVAARRPDLLRSNGGGANAILVRPPLTIVAHGRRRLRLRPERRVAHAVRLGLLGEGVATAEHRGGGAGPVPVRGSVPVEAAAGDVRAVAGRADLTPFDEAWVGNVHAQLGRWGEEPGGSRAPTELTGRPKTDVRTAAARIAAWAEAVRRAGRGGAAGGAGAAASPPPLLLGGDLNLPAGDLGGVLLAGWRTLASSGPDHLTGRGATVVGPPRRPDRGQLSDHAPLLVEVRRG